MTGETPDPTTNPAKSAAGVLGVGAVACVACCAGPILGALSAIGVGSAAGYLLAGPAALAVGALTAVLVIVRRRRRANAYAGPAPTTKVLVAPTLKPAATPGGTGVERSAAGQAL